jgi:cytochrome c oxidase assembly protein subunit 15
VFFAMFFDDEFFHQHILFVCMASLLRFHKIALTTVIAVIILIGIGSLVRATGSGLGCPDWPKCFGMIIPPTSAEQLPPQFDKAQFNLAKTWIEYLNRLAGVVVGLLTIITFGVSLSYRQRARSVVVGAGLSLFLILVTGGVGAKVVSTELTHWVITVHLALAMLVLTSLCYTLYAGLRADAVPLPVIRHTATRTRLLWLGLGMFVLTFVQALLGTQVREEIDIITKTMTTLPRSEWLVQAGSIHEIHRTFSWMTLVGGMLLYRAVIGAKQHRWFLLNAMMIVALIALQMVVGAVLTYMHLPPLFQILHLFIATLMICVELSFVMLTLYTPEVEK